MFLILEINFGVIIFQRPVGRRPKPDGVDAALADVVVGPATNISAGTTRPSEGHPGHQHRGDLHHHRRRRLCH